MFLFGCDAKSDPRFDPEKLPESRVHASIAGLPLLPCAQGAVDDGRCLGLREAGGGAGGADFCGEGI